MDHRFVLALAMMANCIVANPVPIYQIGGCQVGDRTYSVGEELVQLCPTGGKTYAAVCMANGGWDMSGKSSCNVAQVYPGVPAGPGPVSNKVPPQTSQVFCEVLGKQRPVDYFVYKRCPHGRYAKSYCQRDGTWTDIKAECARIQRPSGGIFNTNRRPAAKPGQSSKPNGGFMKDLMLYKALSGGMGNLDPLTMIGLLQGKGMNPLTLISLLGSGSDNSTSPLGNINPAMLMQLLSGQGGGLGALGLLNQASGGDSSSPLRNMDPLTLYKLMSSGGNLGPLQLMQLIGGGGLSGLQG